MIYTIACSYRIAWISWTHSFEDRMMTHLFKFERNACAFIELITSEKTVCAMCLKQKVWLGFDWIAHVKTVRPIWWTARAWFQISSGFLEIVLKRIVDFRFYRYTSSWMYVHTLWIERSIVSLISKLCSHQTCDFISHRASKISQTPSLHDSPTPLYTI